MTDVSWFSQPFPPEGASTAEGIRNQLGRPELDPLTILVRESAQNSWDARLPDHSEPVDYSIDMWTIGPAHVAAWRSLLSQGAPLDDHLPLRPSLRRPTIRVMAVSDRGTSGLGGPTRADSAVTRDNDFVSFVRNIGERRDSELGGGTYGFGKGIFYLISKAGTILLHTRCKVDGGHETRLIGCALWGSYVANEPEGDKRYTGRHWWGDVSREVVEPLVGAAADAMARRLGLKPFALEETGTTIVVIDPNLDELEPAAAAEYMAETITWHLWPKMLESAGRGPAMRFSISCDGIDHPVPDPRKTRPLNLFAAAYEKMIGPDGKELECQRPKKALGRLGLVSRTAPKLEPTRASQVVGIENLVHHVCLMRPAELVVTYRPGPKPPTEYQSYAGVFRANADLDETFAKAEPPTHDTWNSQSLERPESTFVNTTFRRIDDSLNDLLAFGGMARAGAAKVALGAASTMFSSLVGGAWGTGGATDYGRPGSTRTPPRDPAPEEPDEAPEEPAPSPTGDAAIDRPASASSDGTGAASAGGIDPGPYGGGGEQPTAGGSTWPAPPTTPVRPVRRRPRVEYVCDPYYDERSGVSVLVQEFRLPVAGAQRVHIDLAVVLAGSSGRETDPPLGAEEPGLVGWENAAGALFATPTYVIEGGDGSVWRAIVRPVPDTMTEIGVLTEAVQVS